MIPKTNSQYAPWLELKEGMVVGIISEPGPKDHEKLKKPFYCDVVFEGSPYCIGFCMAAYYNISKNPAFGPDTENWIGKKIKFLGLQPIKTSRGSVKGNMWEAVDPTIDLDSDEEPGDLNDHLSKNTPEEFTFGKNKK